MEGTEFPRFFSNKLQNEQLVSYTVYELVIGQKK